MIDERKRMMKDYGTGGWLKATALLASGAMMLSLSACGASGGSQGAAIPERGTDDGTQLVLWTRAPMEAQAKNAVNAYNAGHKNQVKLEIVPDADMEGKVGGAAQTGSLPDLLAGDVVRINYWASEGIFHDVTKQIEGLPGLKDISRGGIDAGTVSGKKYTLPFVLDASVYVWNKSLYKAAGLNPDQGPASLADFERQAKAVAALDRPGVSGTYLLGNSGGGLTFSIFPSLWADGQEALNPAGTKSFLDSQAAQEVYKVYRDLAQTKNGMGAGSQEENGATWTAPFTNGKVGVQTFPFTGVQGLIAQGKKLGFDFGVAPISGTQSGQVSTFLGGDAMGISKDSKHPAQAWNFLQWLMTEAAQKKVFADHGDTAANLATLRNDYASADPRVKLVNAVFDRGRTPVAKQYNAAFNAAGSPWISLIQDQVWGNAAKLKADNQAITKVLAGDGD